MKTVLLVEDNQQLLENTAEILSLANYRVLKAENGKEGLEKMKEHAKTLSLVLCDIMMPVLDGYGVLRAFENDPELKGIPFIFLTAKSDRQDVRKGMDLGADDYLIKPFTGEELLSVIASRIKRAESARELRSLSDAEVDKLFSDPVKFITESTLAEKFHIKKTVKKEIVFNEGETSSYLYLLKKGRVKTFKTNEFGKEYIINIFSEGDFFGYNSLLDEGIHEETCSSLDPSEIAMITKKDFVDMIYNNKEVYMKFIRYISSLLNESGNKLPGLAYHSARKRVAEALIFAARKFCKDSMDSFSFSISRDDLSAISGISPESVSRNLTDFKNEGLISVKEGELVILNFKKLENMKN